MIRVAIFLLSLICCLGMGLKPPIEGVWVVKKVTIFIDSTKISREDIRVELYSEVKEAENNACINFMQDAKISYSMLKDTNLRGTGIWRLNKTEDTLSVTKENYKPEQTYFKINGDTMWLKTVEDSMPNITLVLCRVKNK